MILVVFLAMGLLLKKNGDSKCGRIRAFVYGRGWMLCFFGDIGMDHLRGVNHAVKLLLRDKAKLERCSLQC